MTWKRFELVDEVVSAWSESFVINNIVNQQAKRKNKQPNKDRLHLKIFCLLATILIQMKNLKNK